MSIRSSFFGLEIGKTGLYVSQQGLDVTGHNIANLDTAGYTRQRLINTAYAPGNSITKFQELPSAKVGMGSHVVIIDQLRSSFLDRQFRNEQTSYSNWATRTQGLTYIEALFESGDGGTGLTNVLSSLFSAFNTINGETADQQQRTYLKQQAIKVTEQFNHMYRSLIDQQQDQNLAVGTVVNQINNIADEIAQLNKNIYAYEIDGAPANDLRDKRNLLVDQLSALVDVEYTGEAIGSTFEVKIGGKTLVNHTKTNKLGVITQDNVLGGADEGFEPRNMVSWVNGNNPDDWEAFDLSTLTGGELIAHINLRDCTEQNGAGIPYFINQLNALAQSLVQTVNAQHRQGWSHPAGDENRESHQGFNFFNEDPIYDTDGVTIIGYDVSKVNAGNLRISDDIEASVYNIAVSDREIKMDPASPELEKYLQVGNNKNGLALYNLSLKQDVMLKVKNPDYDVTDPLSEEYTTRTMGSFYGTITSLVLDVATTLEHSKNMTNNGNTLLLSADTQRTSIAGVSIDEEMTNLIKYNHAYNGASRVITAMDEALDKLINQTGRVGL